jgi:hypothetical protein
VHWAGGDAVRFEGDDEEGDAGCAWAAGSDCCSAVVRPDTVGNPFFGAGDDVFVALPGCCGFDSSYV